MKVTVAIGALAACAAAAPDHLEKRQSAFNTGSALMVIETALPPSLLSLAITNSAAASSTIAAQFAAGQTPGWYSSLPADIKTYLVPANAAAASSAASSAISSATAVGVYPTPPAVSAGMSLPYGTNGTGAGVAGQGTGTAYSPPTNSASSTGGSSTGGSGSGSGGSGGSGAGGSSATRAGGSSSSSAGAVPAQSAALGMGLAGAAAVGALFAL